MPPPSARRRFGLLDGMIAIAATAATIAMIQRTRSLFFSPGYFLPPASGWTPSVVTDKVLHVLGYLATPGMSMGSLSLFAMRWRRPRPSLRRLSRQPGFVASCVVVVFLVIGEVEYVTQVSLVGVDSYWGMGYVHDLSMVLMDGVRYSLGRNGYVVAAAWLTLALGRRWQPEPSWIDRFGRVLGAAWLVMIPIQNWILINYQSG
jgi:hypothetical protein